jgi:hypothetical protein
MEKLKNTVLESNKKEERKLSSYPTIVIPKLDPAKAMALGPDGAKKNA